MHTTMTHFVQPDFPHQHAGAARVTGVLTRVRGALARLRSPAGMASLLVTAGLAALIVVAQQVVSAWADGHLLAAWIALWLIVFGLLATFSDAIRAWPLQWQAHLGARRQAAARRAEDRRTWAAALQDPRLMADLDRTLLRAQAQALAADQPMPAMTGAGVVRHLAQQPAAASDISAQPQPVPTKPVRQTTPDWGFRSAPFPGMPRHLQYLSD